MSPRRLLIVTYFYPPLAGGGVHRVLAFTRHLPRYGWECTVVCAGPQDYWVVDESLTARIPPATEVERVTGGGPLSAWLAVRPGDRGRRSTGSFGALRRIANWWTFPDWYAGWARRAGGAARRRIERGGIDALLTSSPPDSVHGAAAIARRARAARVPWVADFRDPWMSLVLRRPPTAWHRRRHERAEWRVLAGADRVLAASRTHADLLRARFAAAGIDPERVVHLPNGYEPADVGSREPRAIEGPGAAALPGPDTFLLAFTGTLALMPDVMVFLDALHEVLARHPDARRRLRARLMGPYERGYEDRAEALGLTGIVDFMGARTHGEARALQRRADLLLHWQPREMPTMVPGKLYEYAESGRPIVAFLDPGLEAAELVRAWGGEVVTPGDRTGMAAAIERRYAAWRAQGPTAAPAPPESLAAHRRERLAGRLAVVLDAVAGGRA